eukprot:gene8451-biopygen6122
MKIDLAGIWGRGGVGYRGSPSRRHPYSARARARARARVCARARGRACARAGVRARRFRGVGYGRRAAPAARASKCVQRGGGLGKTGDPKLRQIRIISPGPGHMCGRGAHAPVRRAPRRVSPQGWVRAIAPRCHRRACVCVVSLSARRSAAGAGRRETHHHTLQPRTTRWGDRSSTRPPSHRTRSHRTVGLGARRPAVGAGRRRSTRWGRSHRTVLLGARRPAAGACRRGTRHHTSQPRTTRWGERSSTRPPSHRCRSNRSGFGSPAARGRGRSPGNSPPHATAAQHTLESEPSYGECGSPAASGRGRSLGSSPPHAAPAQYTL